MKETQRDAKKIKKIPEDEKSNKVDEIRDMLNQKYGKKTIFGAQGMWSSILYGLFEVPEFFSISLCFPYGFGFNY